MRHRLLAVAGLGLFALTAVAAAQSGPRVTAQLFQFRPERLEVTRASRVVWTNQDDIVHTVTAGTPERRDARFDLTLDGKGASAAIEIREPGVYPYFCARHPHMRGEIRVE
jgi:plastocyanin